MFGLIAPIIMVSALAADIPEVRVAIVGGEPITSAELEQRLGGRLMRVRTDEYNIKSAMLEDIVAERLLNAEAKRRKISPDELFRIEIADKTVLPPPSQLEAVYDGTSERWPGLTKEQAVEQMRQGIRQRLIAERKRQYVDELKKATAVTVNLQPPRIDVNADGPSRGNPDAAVTIVVFSDYECPFCSRLTPTLKKLEERYASKLRIVYRDFPLAMHKTAVAAAEAAQCANDQGKFWQMHEKLFAREGRLTPTDMTNAARDIGLDMQIFNTCVSSGTKAAVWKSSQEEGTRVGVWNTPSTFINGRMIVGAESYERFARVIDEELSRPQSKIMQRAMK
jgi:protein-disulfide isomerase